MAGNEPRFRVRPATPDDLPAIVAIHEASFPANFITTLGPGVLRLYYEQLIAAPAGLVLVASAAEGVVGFAAGQIGGWSLARALATRHPARLLRHAPRLLWRILAVPGGPGRLLARLRAAPPAHGDAAADLTSLATAPAWRQAGVGAALVRAFAEAAETGGATRVTLGVQQRDEAVVRFYRRLGFTLLGRTTNLRGETVLELEHRRVPADAARPG